MSLLACPSAAASPDATTVRAWADQVSRVWMDDVTDDGAIRDPMPHPRPVAYGTAMLGYGGLRAAVRAEDPVMLDRALRAIEFAVRTRSRLPFDLWALVSAWEFASSRLHDDPVWQRHRPVIERYLAQMEATVSDSPGSCFMTVGCYNNWRLIDTQAKLRLLATGIRPSGPRALLARRDELTADAERVLRTMVPAAAGPVTGPGLRVLSDPPQHPLAYHTLSVALLDFAADRVPDAFNSTVRRIHRQAARFSAAATSPDGETAWYGRSHDQSWAAAAVLASAARWAALDRPFAATHALTAVRAWQRLTGIHGLTADGHVAVTPAVKTGRSYSGMDGYAGVGVYNGLTLLLANAAADQLDSRPLPPAEDTGDMLLDDRRGSGTVVMAAGRAWVALQTRTQATGDARYATGLLRVKLGGADVRAVPPYTADRAAGFPVLRARDGRTVAASLRTVTATPSGAILTGVWGQRKRLRARLTVTRRRVTLTVTVPSGATLIGREYLPLNARRVTGAFTGPAGTLTLRGAVTTSLEMTSVGSSATSRLLLGRWRSTGRNVRLSWSR